MKHKIKGWVTVRQDVWDKEPEIGFSRFTYRDDVTTFVGPVEIEVELPDEVLEALRRKEPA